MSKKPIHVRLNQEVVKQIKDAAKAEGTTVPHCICSAVVKELKNYILPEIRELIKQ